MNSDEFARLKPKAVRVLVAELCGWTKLKYDNHYTPAELFGWPYRKGHWRESHPIELEQVPDYLNDLNACHEFEMGLSDKEEREYAEHLSNIVPQTVYKSKADAAQRCEALVLTKTGERNEG